MTYEEIALEAIAKAIEIAMDERKLTKTDLERKSGVSRTIIYKILRKRSGTYDIVSLVRVMRQLQIHIDFSLMDETNNNFPVKPSQN